MRALIFTATLMSLVGLAQAQAQAPAAGSGGGGPVTASDTAPNIPKGAQPPGTPSGATPGERELRNAAGQNVIGKTATPGTAVPGNTTAPDAGVRK